LRRFPLLADSHESCLKWHKKRRVWAGISLHSQSHEALQSKEIRASTAFGHTAP
jgi:hypothetical protein